ncbi:MAG: alanyl-tRNA synthetase [Pirellulaceae bacterium]|jgi:alanyl-tRNA synthetase
MNSDELREKYLTFFESKGHSRQPSDVLVPTWDPSVLFTPAGMNQFKDHFLGKVKLEFTRATTSQKCLRTGDIDNVGRTAYHHTFFEMLGNFSFGDYFKREAINWAWEFLTAPKWLGLDAARLSVTVYQDDEEAANIWMTDIKLPSSKITRMDEADNFWPASAPSQGPNGVCGPCSEIFYLDDSNKEVEIWNLVFTQFNRVGELPDNLRPLPSKNIDTGMGLERTAATLQGKDTNYHIDILLPIVEAAAEICGQKYDADSDNGRRLRRITDHVRACTFAIHENVYPGANKEKYVIRRLLRRAVLDMHQMGGRDPALFQLAPVVADMMKVGYPELSTTLDRVQQVIKKEEETFLVRLDDGLARIENIFEEAKGTAQVMVNGDQAADLYQTYGVPPELVEAMAAEQSMTFDWEGFRAAMKQHGIDSGGDQFQLFKTGPIEQLKKAVQETEFLGYDTESAEAEIHGIADAEQLFEKYDKVGEENEVTVVLNQTPFYGESGGQVGDSGEITGEGFRFVIKDTQKDGNLVLHHGYLSKGSVAAGATVTATVGKERRAAIQRAHSATHILHYALQQNLGSHAQQQGSKVDQDILRFDFTNMSAVEADTLSLIEKQVIDRVDAAEEIRWEHLPLADARTAGAMMLFGEKYPDPVRMVSMGEFSKELCGGIHLTNTSQVGEFEIVTEEGVSAGTRRITAYTGTKAAEHAAKTRQALQDAADALGVAPLSVVAAAQQLAGQVRDLKKQLAGGSQPAELAAVEAGDPSVEVSYAAARKQVRDAARALNVPILELPARIVAMHKDVANLKQQLQQLAQSGDLSADSLLEKAEDVNGVSVVVLDVPGANPNLMRQLIDQMRKKSELVAVLLAAAQGEDKVMLVAGISKALIERGASAGNWVKQVAPVVGGGGGGKPDLAQAGGKQPENLPAALKKAKEVIAEMLS